MQTVFRTTLSVKSVPQKIDRRKRRLEYTFGYHDGSRKVNKATAAWCASLRVPPAWQDVVFYPASKKVVATGRDEAGRDCRIYHSEYTKRRQDAKYRKVAAKSRQIERLLDKLRSYPLTDDTAMCLLLIRLTGLRVGTEGQYGEVQAFGATTLQCRHLKLNQFSVTLDFIGKKGVRQLHTVNDPQMVKSLKRRKKAQWSAPVFPDTDANWVRWFLGELAPGVTPKDLRTWHAQQIAEAEVAKRKRAAKTASQFKKWRKSVGEKVAKFLGNTSTVALKSYIAPNTFDRWTPQE